MFFLDLQTLRSEDEGWLVLDITAASDRWLPNHHRDLGLRLYVETADGEAPGLSRELPWGSWEVVPAEAPRPVHRALSPEGRVLGREMFSLSEDRQTGEVLDMARPQPGMPSAPSYTAADLLRARILSRKTVLSGQQASTLTGSVLGRGGGVGLCSPGFQSAEPVTAELCRVVTQHRSLFPGIQRFILHSQGFLGRFLSVGQGGQEGQQGRNLVSLESSKSWRITWKERTDRWQAGVTLSSGKVTR